MAARRSLSAITDDTISPHRAGYPEPCGFVYIESTDDSGAASVPSHHAIVGFAGVDESESVKRRSRRILTDVDRLRNHTCTGTWALLPKP